MESAKTIAGVTLPQNYSLVKKFSVFTVKIGTREIPKYEAEFWTSKQRQSSSLHEISYRACFKAEVPHFFIEWLTKVGDTVYDPFNGRGTTIIEAALLGRKIIANDINPLSEILSHPRLTIPNFAQLQERLKKIKIDSNAKASIDLSMFFHNKTESEIVSLKNYLHKRHTTKKEDDLDRWIRMIATNRLTGHSIGFFSVYTLPPNQAVSQDSQKKINKRLRQRPEYRDTHAIILKKSKALLKKIGIKDISTLNKINKTAKFITEDARKTNQIKNNSIDLTVTSPHFLNTINYFADNWLRCWFNSIDAQKVAESIRESRDVQGWSLMMEDVLRELFRITKKGGWVAFEVGEVRNGTLKLEDIILPIGELVGFRCEGILINIQKFTKTAHIWGVHNNSEGTNTNRIILFRKG